MRPRETLIASAAWPTTRETDLLRAQLEVLLIIDERLAKLTSPIVVMPPFETPASVPMSAVAEPAFDPLRDCEQDVEDIERMGLVECPVCGEPASAHRERFGEPPDRPGSDAT